jgi:hypothetical protein
MKQKNTNRAAANIKRNRMLFLVLAVSLVASVVVYLVVRSDSLPPKPAPMGSFSGFRRLVANDFMDDKAILSRVADEANRRLLAAECYPGQVEGVLAGPMLNLHSVLAFENLIFMPVVPPMTLESVWRMMDEATPAAPKFVIIKRSYEEIGEPDLGLVVSRIDESIRDNTFSSKWKDLEAMYRSAYGRVSGRIEARIVYARVHRDEILKEKIK